MSVGKQDATERLLCEKQHILGNKAGGPSDNLKPASGEIYNACKSILGLTQCGNDAKTFMRDTLAPLIEPGMKVYDELKCDIFGEEAGSRTCR